MDLNLSSRWCSLSSSKSCLRRTSWFSIGCFSSVCWFSWMSLLMNGFCLCWSRNCRSLCGCLSVYWTSKNFYHTIDELLFTLFSCPLSMNFGILSGEWLRLTLSRGNGYVLKFTSPSEETFGLMLLITLCSVKIIILCRKGVEII